MFHPTEHSYAKKKKNQKFWTWRYSFLIDRTTTSSRLGRLDSGYIFLSQLRDAIKCLLAVVAKLSQLQRHDYATATSRLRPV